MYTAQRWTGGIAFFLHRLAHLDHAFYRSDLHAYPNASFGKVQAELMNPALLAFYVVGLIAASWHFAYGIWLFAAKWGITSGEKARQRFLVVCLALFALLMSGVGLASFIPSGNASRNHLRNLLWPRCNQSGQQGNLRKAGASEDGNSENYRYRRRPRRTLCRDQDRRDGRAASIFSPLSR
jgi:succinate dehydrogenase/fumarate reductase cytochrome b subunit